VTGSYADVQDLIERAVKEGSSWRSLKFKKMGVLPKMIIVFLVVGLLIGVGFFCFKFFNRTVLCQEG
jgi:hypothetical protein